MAVKIPKDDDAVRGWMEVAHGSRILQHCLRGDGDPQSGSPFAQVAVLYPFEKVSDRARAYLAAAIEHLVFCYAAALVMPIWPGAPAVIGSRVSA